MLFELVAITLAVLNATIPGQQIPIQVQTSLVGDEPQAAQVQPATNSIFDSAFIATLIGMGVTLFKGYRSNQERSNANADTQQNAALSLKATDEGVADIANNISSALSKLAEANPQNAEALKNCKVVAQQNAEAWNKDLKEYYKNTPPTTSKDVGLDKVREKLKQVNKMTTPTSDDKAVTP